MTTAAQFNRIDADGRAFVEFQKLRLELAWRHFEFHARQRTTMFHFFVLLVPLLIGGFFYILRENVAPGASAATTSALAANATTAATLVTAIGAVLSFVFLAFDMRNRQLYRMSQDNLRLLENDFLYAEAYTPLNYNMACTRFRLHPPTLIPPAVRTPSG
jgi:hypothetical protein